MKKFLTTFCLSIILSCALRAQESVDSVRVRLETDPGAEIGIDGDISSTNILIKKVPVGRHTVTVSFGADFTRDYELMVSPDGHHTYTYPVAGKLSLSTTPSVSATVYVDGIARGKAPLTLSLLGDHNIRVVGDPLVWHEQSERLSLSPFDSLSRVYTLVKRPPRLYGVAMATYSPTTNAVGGMLGICRRFGAYMRFGITPTGAETFDNSDYGRPGYNGRPYGPGYYEKGKRTYVSFSAGLMARLCKFAYLYAGAGYADYVQTYEYAGNNPGIYSREVLCGYGASGCAIDAGVLFKWKALLVSCGYSTIVGNNAYPAGTRPHDIYIGVGCSIHKNKKKK